MELIILPLVINNGFQIQWLHYPFVGTVAGNTRETGDFINWPNSWDLYQGSCICGSRVYKIHCSHYSSDKTHIALSLFNVTDSSWTGDTRSYFYIIALGT